MSPSVWAYFSNEYAEAYTTVNGISGASPAQHEERVSFATGKRTCTPVAMWSSARAVCS